MINPNAIVLLPGTSLIVPERECFRRFAAGPDCFGQAEVGQGTEALLTLRLKESVFQPVLRVLGIHRIGDHIVVSQQQEWRFL